MIYRTSGRWQATQGALPAREQSPATDYYGSTLEPESARIPARVRWTRRGYQFLAWILVLCIGIQVFLAGLAVFGDPTRWQWHVNFIHLFEFVPVLMLLLVFLARMPRWTAWLTVLLYVLITMQYVFASFHDSGNSELAALHAVNALAIFWLAVHLAWRARHAGKNSVRSLS